MNRSLDGRARTMWTPALAAAVTMMMMLATGSGAAVAGQPPGGGGYTTAQAESGRAVYERECAVCHQSNLQGTFEAPQLAGESFLQFWGDLSPGDLFVRISGSMPPGQAGSLTDEAYLDVVAYLLQANGAPAGGAALTEAATVSIGAAVNPASPAVAPAGGGAPAPAEAATSSSAPEPGGVTVAGTVDDYRPVTDAMLRNPDDGDWLMIRRNYQAWNYSPLADVDRSNAGELELAWVWAMNEGGWNAPSPIVHDGVMYLASIGPVVQALDAATGDLIWEHEGGGVDHRLLRHEPQPRHLRGQAVHGHSDARLIALDARTGERVWDTVIADHAEGFRNTSGPVVIGGTLVQGLSGCDRYTLESCFISGYDADTGERLWRFNTVARSDEPGGNTWANVPDYLRGGRRHVDHRQLRSRPRPGLLRRGAGQAVGGAQPRHDGGRPRALHQLYRPPCGRATASSSGTSSTCRARPLDLDEVYERVLVDTGGRKAVFSAGKHGILWKLDRETGEFLGHKETVYQNVFDRIDPETGAVTYRQDIADAQFEQLVPACPSTAGGKNWHPMGYHPGIGSAGPAARAVVHGAGRPRGRLRARLGRRRMSSRPFHEMPGNGWPVGQAGRLRRRDPGGGVEHRAAADVPDRRSHDGRGAGVRRRPRPPLRAFDVETGEELWRARLGTSVAGLSDQFPGRRKTVRRGVDRPRRRPARG